ncbi:MAG: thiamine pyrophosphate-dependent enzyme [Pseudomonadota bacterium]
MADNSVGSGVGLDRREVVSTLLVDRQDMLVVSGLGSPTYDLMAAGDHDANFYLWGAMGGTAMVGLGLALAQPERRILVLTGDGEMLMGLGSLATIAAADPANLALVVLDNGIYGETGQQASATGMGCDFVTVARGAGWHQAETLENLDQAAAWRGALAAGSGPWFARIAITSDLPPRAMPARDGVYLKNRFRAHLGLAPN